MDFRLTRFNDRGCTSSAKSAKPLKVRLPHKTYFLIVGCLAVFAWVGVFAIGVLVDSAPFRDEMLKGNVASAVIYLVPARLRTRQSTPPCSEHVVRPDRRVHQQPGDRAR